VVTGFLGVGKTTALLDLFSHRPDGERWAVLVNEFGEIGIDGAVLTSGGLSVAEVTGGCICCSAGLALKVTLSRLLREQSPDRLLIEPTGLAHPAAVIDTLRTPGLREHAEVSAVIGLVDPRHCTSARHLQSATWQDQVRLADVLVANKTDLCEPDDLAAFDALAAAAWPPKRAVTHTTRGRLDPAWLALTPPAEGTPSAPPHTPEAVAQGWIWPPTTAFDRARLQEALQVLVRPNAALPHGALRLKGIFRTRRAWLLVAASTDRITWSPVGHRADSRVELIALLGPADWDAVRARLEETRLR